MAGNAGVGWSSVADTAAVRFVAAAGAVKAEGPGEVAGPLGVGCAHAKTSVAADTNAKAAATARRRGCCDFIEVKASPARTGPALESYSEQTAWSGPAGSAP